MAKGKECPNGHAANSDGNCSDPSCEYRIAERHKGPNR